jgi:hypothetical protein
MAAECCGSDPSAEKRAAGGTETVATVIGFWALQAPSSAYARWPQACCADWLLGSRRSAPYFLLAAPPKLPLCCLTFELTPTRTAGSAGRADDDVRGGRAASAACRAGSAVERGVRQHCARRVVGKALPKATCTLPVRLALAEATDVRPDRLLALPGRPEAPRL